MPDEFQSSKPIYMQIVDKITVDIVRGKQKIGDKLPSVREMAVQMGVNPNTVQRTYSELERMGIVETKRGQGTFVVENEDLLSEVRGSLQNKIIQNFVEKMEEMGVTKQEMMAYLKQYLEEDSYDNPN
ncbi:GntR family transcriptional regulator [Metabacillus malikii]|uniref:GntR family transcriptional regulator n=1 Tax=Metabacillus malikii TaxID=1504265 RepID=A0ABT9ZHF2_9BACI|nr:GntR family transcriptional regulator [Metabacillus malikii]MDQ0231716.1 GntR family transcriptional regulator [Metabacillus malikii]